MIITTDGNRQTGRTTLMLKAANSAKMAGEKITIIVANKQMINYYVKQSKKLDLDLERSDFMLMSVHVYQNSLGPLWDIEKVFVDHYVTELQLAKARNIIKKLIEEKP